MNAAAMKIPATHLLACSAALACAINAASVCAQEYPTKPVVIVVPFAAGGAVDTVARVLGQKLTDSLGKPVVIDNRPGNSGNIGARYVAKAPNDGHTLLMAALTTHSMNVTLMEGQLGFDLDRDFQPAALVGYLPLVLVVNGSLPVKSVSDLVALGKARPGQLAFGSAGTGSIEHIAAELFKRQAGIEILHVPYKGAAPAMIDLIGGQIAAIFATAPTAIANLKGGRLKPLMTATAKRLSTLPDVPTAREAGLPGFEVAATYGVLLPAGTPAAIVTRLNREIDRVVALPDVQAKFQQLGIEIATATPDELSRRIRGEIAKWGKVIKDANIRIE
jgi:tripartite-type tricarboxylate transporter receptor subunit TctC